MSLIDDIIKDIANGTPGPWRVHNCESYGERCLNFYQEIWSGETDILVTTEVTRAHNDGGAANIRRIARVPKLEQIALAAEELSLAIENYIVAEEAWDDRAADLTDAAEAIMEQWQTVVGALAKFREATQ